MGYVNRTPKVADILADLDDRLTRLERSKRPTAVTVNGIANMPVQAQPGDFVVDTSTGFMYVFMFDANTTLTAATTYTTFGTTYTFTVADRTGIKPGQSIKLTNTTGSVYWLQVVFSHVATTGAGTFNAILPIITNPTGYSLPANPTTLNIGATVEGSSWRQVAFVSDLMAKSIVTNNTGGGANSATGSNTGGIGEVLGTGYLPH